MQMCEMPTHSIAYMNLCTYPSAALKGHPTIALRATAKMAICMRNKTTVSSQTASCTE